MEINHFSNLREMPPIYKDRFSSLLAKCFSNDPLMCRTIGDERWKRIAPKYFRIQINYSDTLLAVANDESPIGVCFLKSPQSEMHLATDMYFQLRTALLLGKHFKYLAKLSLEIADQMPNKRHWYINQLAVHPDFRSLGIASKLVEKIITLKKEEDILVDCDQPLCPFYELFGFYEIERFKDEELALMVHTAN